MNSNCKYFCRFLFAFLLMLNTVAFSQEPGVNDTVSVPAHGREMPVEKPAENLKKGRIGFYVDYLNFINRLINDNVKYEGGINLLAYKKFLLALEGGSALLRPKSALINGKYEAEGFFWKTGIDFIINQNREKDSRVYIGARYASSAFEDRVGYEVASHLWPGVSSSFSRENLKAEWYEILFGTEGKLISAFYLGWTIRYRMMSTSPDFELVPVYHIPGFGSTSSRNTLGLNFYLKYQISW